MTKRALLAVAGFLGLCSPLFGQQTNRAAQSDAFTLKQLTESRTADISAAFGQPENVLLNNSFVWLAPLTLADGPFLSHSNAFGWMDARSSDVLAPAPARERPNGSAAPATDSADDVVDLRSSSYAHGEIGLLYGRSTGKFGREVKSGYIIGDVGDDNIHISVGAFYEESSGRVPRFGR